jgi:hypothetical protein
MPIDAEVEAAVAAMRSVRTTGARVHEEVLRAYAITAVQAPENARREDFVRRAGLNNKPDAAVNGGMTECPGPPATDGQPPAAERAGRDLPSPFSVG